MDDETPEMEAISAQLREVMRAWIEDPDNAELKERYIQLQAVFQRAFLEHQRSQMEAAGGSEAALR